MSDSLNEIRLNHKMLADLYGHVLISAPPAATASPDQSAAKLLGNNARYITILVNQPDHSFLPETELAFLTKMLGACQLNIGDVAIVNMAGSSIALPQIIEQLQPEKIIVFGDIPGIAEKNIPKQLGTLFAPALGQLVADLPEAKALKAKLWAALRQLFNIA